MVKAGEKISAEAKAMALLLRKKLTQAIKLSGNCQKMQILQVRSAPRMLSQKSQAPKTTRQEERREAQKS